jgi:hypothetical protein
MLAACIMLVYCLAKASSVKMEATYFSEMLVHFHQTTHCYIPKEITLHNFIFEHPLGLVDNLFTGAVLKVQLRAALVHSFCATLSALQMLTSICFDILNSKSGKHLQVIAALYYFYSALFKNLVKTSLNCC